jgi:hypothetical protein
MIKRLEHKISFLFIFFLLCTFKCHSAETSAFEAPLNQQSAAATIDVDALRSRILAVKTTGNLCEEGTVSVTLDQPGSGDSSVFTAIFSADPIQGTQAGTKGRCSIQITYQPQDGFYNMPAFFWQGSAMTELGTVVVTTHYQFLGAASREKLTHNLVEGDFVLTDRPTKAWPRSNVLPNTPVTLRVDIQAIATGDNTLFSLTSLDAATNYRDGGRWRKRNNTQLLEAPAGGISAYCAGINARACVTGLACELTGSNAVEGSCVDPLEVVPAHAEDDVCGGYRNIACESGLACWHNSSKEIAEKRLGFCTPVPALENDTCDIGIPSISCSTGLFCRQGPASTRCVQANGQLGSYCGTNLPECDSGLYCNGTYCARPRVGEGEHCDAETLCRRGLKCTNQICTK